jgi:hypothetical protein
MDKKHRTTAHGKMPVQKLAWPLANEMWFDVAATKVKTPFTKE